MCSLSVSSVLEALLSWENAIGDHSSDTDRQETNRDGLNKSLYGQLPTLRYLSLEVSLKVFYSIEHRIALWVMRILTGPFSCLDAIMDHWDLSKATFNFFGLLMRVQDTQVGSDEQCNAVLQLLLNGAVGSKDLCHFFNCRNKFLLARLNGLLNLSHGP